MKKIKRFLSLFLVSALMFSMLSVGSIAADTETGEGSIVYQFVTEDSYEPATGSVMAWTLECYDGSEWLPAENVNYKIYDDTGIVSENTTDNKGAVVITKTDNGYPYVWIDADSVSLNLYSGMESGDYRVVQDASGTDSAWGLLAGYAKDGESYSLNQTGAIGFVNSNNTSSSQGDALTVSKKAPVELLVCHGCGWTTTSNLDMIDHVSDERCSYSVESVKTGNFTFALSQVISTDSRDRIIATEPAGNISATKYDSSGTGTDVTISDGTFSLESGEKIVIYLPEGTMWQVREDEVLEWTLADVCDENGSSVVYEDNAVTYTAGSGAHYFQFCNDKETGAIYLTNRAENAPSSEDTFTFYLLDGDGDPVAGELYYVRSGDHHMDVLITGSDGSFKLKADDRVIFYDLGYRTYTLKESLDTPADDSDYCYRIKEVDYAGKDGSSSNTNAEQTVTINDDNAQVSFTFINEYAQNKVTSEGEDPGPSDHNYDYGNIAWDWSSDYGSATATFTCTDCGETVVLEAFVTAEEGSEGIIYTATVTGPDGNECSDVKVAASSSEPEAHEYDYTSIIWRWSDDHGTAWATVTCTVCGEGFAFEAEVTISEDDEGHAVYTASITGTDGKTYTNTVTVETAEPEPEEHDYDYSNIEWTWHGYRSATATVKCKDCGTELVIAAGVTEGTDEEGNTVYTATVTGADGNEYSTSITVQAECSHVYDYGDIVWDWSDDMKSATATVYCTECGETFVFEAEITVSVDDEGNTVYTAVIDVGGETYSDTVVAEAVPDDIEDDDDDGSYETDMEEDAVLEDVVDSEPGNSSSEDTTAKDSGSEVDASNEITADEDVRDESVDVSSGAGTESGDGDDATASVTSAETYDGSGAWVYALMIAAACTAIAGRRFRRIRRRS